MSKQSLIFSSVTKDFGNKRALKNVSFRVDEGEFAVMLGPNGAGKTTTVRIIGGVVRPTQGSLSLFGHQVDFNFAADLQLTRRKIGIQNDGSLYERLTARENLIFWGQLFGLDRDRYLDKIDELLFFLELQNDADLPLTKFSKGMKQKVLLARALLHDPKLLILDEPTSGLDPLIADKFLTYLNKLRKKTGMSVLMCTHRLEMVDEVADRLIVLRNGKLLAQGGVEQLLHTHTSGVVMVFEVGDIDQSELDEARLRNVHARVVERTSFGGRLRLRLSIDNEKFIPEVARLLSEQLHVYKMEPELETVRRFYSSIMGE